MKRYLSRNLLRWLGAGTWIAFLAPTSSFATLPKAPEQEARALAEILRPVADEDWKVIAGERVSEKYEIQRGDTLYDISKRLFGDSKYWPKIWALNNGNITNPHLIRPGNRIEFNPGSGSSLPSVSIASAPSQSPNMTDADSDVVVPRIPARSGRSEEWRKLPRQPWELVDEKPRATVDEQGFDKRNKVVQQYTGYELPWFVSSERIRPLGEIIGSRIEGVYMMLRDTVIIRGEQEMQVGETYALVGEPMEFISKLNKREIYSYQVLGKVKVLGVKDGKFLGEIVQSSHFIRRGVALVRVPPKVKTIDPVAGPSPIEAQMLTDKQTSTYASAQYKQVIVDRGTDDGVREGMVFRVHRYDDPITKERLTDSDVISEADLVVVQASERASTAIILRGTTAIQDGATGILLTDVSDVGVKRKSLEKTLESVGKSQLDKLDDMDVSGGLGRKEATELRQLERWKENGQPLQAIPVQPAPGAQVPAPAPQEQTSKPEEARQDEAANTPENSSVEITPESAQPVPPEDLPPPPPSESASSAGIEAGAETPAVPGAAPEAPATAPSAPIQDDPGTR